MGELALHAERGVGGTWSYVDVLERPKDYGLFHVLGAPGFSKYGVLPDGARAKQLRTTPELPADVSLRLRAIASRTAGSEGTWRHASRDAILGYPWTTVFTTSFLAGPVGFASYRAGQRSSRWIADTTKSRAYLAQIGARVVSHDDMAAVIDADGGRVLRDDPLEHRVRVVTELSWQQSLASVFDFEPALDWLRSLDGSPIRIAFWIEV